MVFLLLLCFLVSGTLRAQTDFYWEAPEVFSPAQGSFPASAFNGEVSVVAWQESEAGPVSGPDGLGDGRISVSAAVKSSGGEWRIHRSLGGPYVYSGAEPAVLSVSVDPRGRIFIAVAASAAQTEILVSEDRGGTFRAYRVDSGSESSVAPRLFPRADGGYVLFVTRGRDQSLSIYYALSEDGYAWSDFRPFVSDSALQLNFLPAHAALNGTDYVIFQSFVGSVDAAPAFQLYLSSSSDGGRAWSSPRLVTGFQDAHINPGAAADRFDNQRPHLSIQNGRLFLVWERRYGLGSPRIYGAFLRPDGALDGRAEQINSVEAYCNNPIAFQYEGRPTVVWFDNRRGNDRGFIAQRGTVEWRNHELSGATAAATFARPVVDGDGLNLFWQSRSRGADRIFSLVPDMTVAEPRLTAQNFTPGRRTRGDRARISWNIPYDSSGIYGFSYTWSRSAGEEPPRRILAYAGVTAVEQIADDDGTWYFSIMAQDFAGNWSKPSSIEFVRDTTPPPSANIIRPELDERGYLPSNTFSIRWNPPPASDILGYTWSFDYLAPLDLFASMDGDGFTAEAQRRFSESPSPAPRVMGADNSASFTNEDNGVWRFSVFPVDTVGNIGPPSAIIFRMDKYVPHTYITYVDAGQDEEGILSVRLIGRGFSEGGRVTRLILDRDGLEPYDREYFLSLEDYSILSDREIGGLRIDDIEEGFYRVGLEHPRRGLYLSAPLIAVDEMGTIKFGDFSQSWKPSWSLRAEPVYVFNAGVLIIAGILLLCLIGFFASVRGIGNVITESAAIRIEAAALITGDLMPLEKKRQLKRVKRRGIGLRIKLASFTIGLVLVVVVMVSVPLYYMMTRTQQETLLRGLWDRSTVLLEGLASSARAYLPSGEVLELGFLPAQMAAIPEARYVTITGYGSNSAIYDDRVWATNDPEILSKIDTAELQPGVSRLTDVLSPRLEGISGELGDRAREQVGELSASITALTQEALSLALRTDAESRQRMNDIQVTTRSLETRLTEELTEISREIGSEPRFSTEDLSAAGSLFVFFKPVMYRQGSEDVYFRGLIRLEVSIDSIIAEIAEGQRDLLRVILLVALSAIAIGVVGALIFSTLIIRPIRKLVSHVERIRDTDDKSKLEGVEIEIKSKDEIAVLGNTINDMTHGLVKAAQAASDLTIGKEIQKKFIPLEINREGNKQTSGFKDTKNAEFFGYYEGAKGVSGDYFDYQDLDGRYFAVIKCDVAGKGIPAALIMIQVATMFLSYFKQWKPTEKGMHIEEVVYQINDFIEALAFKGRFAAFTLALFDSQTGLIRFCNAGDNIVHWYDASERKMKTVTLKETPATGVLPNFLVESKGGYTVQTLTIDHGDILFLYTDGIEEAKRKFRDANFKEILCTEGGAPNDTPHANHSVGQGDEEMGPDRVEAIINAVMNKESYSLHKYHNPEGESDLKFDFSNCQGKVEEAIMAMVSVEKIFRLFKDPKADEDSRVLVDKKVDEFLKTHFLQYRNYCSFTRENPGNDAYIYYTHVNEDAQYDDLTIIGINRK